MKSGKKVLIYVVVAVLLINWGIFALILTFERRESIDSDEEYGIKFTKKNPRDVTMVRLAGEGDLILEGEIDSEWEGEFALGYGKYNESNLIGNASGSFRLMVPKWARGELWLAPCTRYDEVNEINATFSIKLIQVFPLALPLSFSISSIVIGLILLGLTYRGIKQMRKEQIEPWEPGGVW